MTQNTSDPSLLSTGLSGFSNIRKRGMVYVDKTAILYQFARLRIPIFLSRPRRFGKSLLVNTLESLFFKGLDDFRGLDIDTLWNDTTYRVIHLDFSSMSSCTPRGLRRKLADDLVQCFDVKDKVALTDSLNCYRDPDEVLKEILRPLKDNSIVLLIDEYDAPITHHMKVTSANDSDLHEILSILQGFYAAVKQYVDRFRHIFITGITRIAHVSIFSAFNNLKDISLDAKYNALLGFTQEEIENNFSPYVEHAAHVLGRSRQGILTALKDRYDGYRFSLDAPGTVCPPWSVLNFFMDPELGFQNYWFESGGTPSLLMNFIKMRENFFLREYAKQKFSTTVHQLKAKYEVQGIPPEILFTQAGYLTLQRQSQTRAELVFPNTEVAESLLQLALTIEGMNISDTTYDDCDLLIWTRLSTYSTVYSLTAPQRRA